MAKADITGLLTGLAGTDLEQEGIKRASAVQGQGLGSNLARSLALQAPQREQMMRQGAGGLFGVDTRTAGAKVKEQLANVDVKTRAGQDEAVKLIAQVDAPRALALQNAFSQQNVELEAAKKDMDIKYIVDPVNQKTLANFQGQLSIARQNIEKNPNVLSSESKRINKLARNLEDAHDIKLPRLRDPDAAKYFSPKRLKELEAQGLDIVKAAERAGYTIEMPKGAITVKEFVGEGKHLSVGSKRSKK